MLVTERCVALPTRKDVTPRRTCCAPGRAHWKAIASARLTQPQKSNGGDLLIDTPGAFASVRGTPHLEAIAVNLREMMNLPPIIAAVMAKAVPGGALGIAWLTMF
jgi:hypothetical protein